MFFKAVRFCRLSEFAFESFFVRDIHMQRYAMKRRLVLLFGLGVGVGLVGCSREEVQEKQSVGKAEHNTAHGQESGGHEHKPGAHGGAIVEIGEDSYHAEALLDAEGRVRVFMLGSDETRIKELKDQTLTSYIKGDGDTEAVGVELRGERQEGDSEGMVSQFVGELPANLRGKSLTVTVPNLPIDGERFRVSFRLEAGGGSHGSNAVAMAPQEERTLYLTPGGKYTQEDIDRNGGTVPSVKFQGVLTEHDDNPQVGDRICPISKTKANEKFAWVIGGEVYTFCCPPCIDEYVAKAKEKPDELKPADSFVKQ